MTTPSQFDDEFFPVSRAFIDRCRSRFVNSYLTSSDLICDIGNQGKGISDIDGYKLFTLDIAESTKPDILADITKTNGHIKNGYFDALLCTEVLEHVLDPFAAIREIKRIVKVGGYIFFSTPLNARIHGPIPDCWRFTEFGLKVLYRDFQMLEFHKLDTPDRNLFPLQYCVIVRKIGTDLTESDPAALQFQKVD